MRTFIYPLQSAQLYDSAAGYPTNRRKKPKQRISAKKLYEHPKMIEARKAFEIASTVMRHVDAR